jgi:NitT/TauT family transport system permease protein
MLATRRQTLNVVLSGWALVCVLGAYVLVGTHYTFLPSLAELTLEAPAFFTDPETYRALGATAVRVVVSLLVALVLGLGVALLVVRGGLAGRIAESYVGALLTVPSTIAALVALFVFRREPVAVYVVVVLVILPFVAMTLIEGMRALDPKLATMARVYRFSAAQRLRHLTVPQLTPFLIAAARNENAHAWRVVVLAELFAVNSGMGWQFTRAWDQFLLDQVMLWLAAFVLILLASEYLVLAPLERLALRWRGKVQP